MKNKILFIINPKAGAYKKSLLKIIDKKCKNANISYAIKLTNKRGDAEILSSKIKAEKFNIITACGGDGTINEVVNGIYKNKDFEKLSFAILPLGTTNVLAKEINIKSVHHALNILINGKKEKIWTGVVKDFNTKKERYFTMMASVGFDAYVVNNVSLTLKKYTGKFAYIYQTIKTAILSKLPEIEITIGKEKIKAYTIMVCNGAFYAGKFKAAPNAKLQKNELEAVILTKKGFFSILKYSIALVLNSLYKMPSVATRLCKEIKINGKKFFPIQADGDIIASLPAEIKISDRKISIVK